MDSVDTLESVVGVLLAKVVLIFRRGFSGAKKCLGLLRVASAFDGVVVIATVSATLTYGCCTVGADTERLLELTADSLVTDGVTIVGTNVVNN